MSGIQCEHCGVSFPIDYFPDISIGMICESCMLGMDSSATARKLEAKVQSMAGKMLDVKDVSELLPKVKTILGSVYKDFGGPRGFAARIHWMIEELCARNPVPASAPQLMIQLMKLHLSIEQTEDHNDAKRMTDEQVKNEQQIALLQIAMDAANDPTKQSLLFQMLKAQGIDARQMSTTEREQSLIDETRGGL